MAKERFSYDKIDSTIGSEENPIKLDQFLVNLILNQLGESGEVSDWLKATVGKIGEDPDRANSLLEELKVLNKASDQPLTREELEKFAETKKDHDVSKTEKDQNVSDFIQPEADIEKVDIIIVNSSNDNTSGQSLDEGSKSIIGDTASEQDSPQDNLI